MRVSGRRSKQHKGDNYLRNFLKTTSEKNAKPLPETQTRSFIPEKRPGGKVRCSICFWGGVASQLSSEIVHGIGLAQLSGADLQPLYQRVAAAVWV